MTWIFALAQSSSLVGVLLLHHGLATVKAVGRICTDFFAHVLFPNINYYLLPFSIKPHTARFFKQFFPLH